MGTRGVYGFRVDGQDKVTYNHFDSYPDWLGRKVLDYICLTSAELMRTIASEIVLVDHDSPPSAELVERYREFADLRVSTQSHEEWYCLLRRTQGDLSAYHSGLRHMIDNSDFLADSLFCEWAYIINLDTDNLEVYRGFNKDLRASGRYAQLSIEEEYKGVALVDSIPLEEIVREEIPRLLFRLNRCN